MSITTNSNSLRFPMPSLKNDLLLRVFNRLPVSRVPVWMMRQAGRSDPAYREIREKDGRPLEQLFMDVEKSIEISLLPKRIGVDAIIMFQDILTPLYPMGASFKFRPGPVLDTPFQDMVQVKKLKNIDPVNDLNAVGQILQGLQDSLQGELPILGFAGSPMTLAFFMIAGKSPGKDYTKVLQFIEDHPQTVHALLERLTEMTIDYLNYQADSGAHAVQLFESFGDVIPRHIYERFVQPTHIHIFKKITSRIPSILFAKECDFPDLMLNSGAAALSVGQCVNLKQAREMYGESHIFQGNIDNLILQNGTETEITQAIQECFSQTRKHNHILNLNHGVLAKTPFENVKFFIQKAKELGTIH